MSEFIEPKHIPVEYGGTLSYGGPDSCRYHSPQEIAFRKLVHELNAKHPGQSFPRVAPPHRADRSSSITAADKERP